MGVTSPLTTKFCLLPTPDVGIIVQSGKLDWMVCWLVWFGLVWFGKLVVHVKMDNCSEVVFGLGLGLDLGSVKVWWFGSAWYCGV